MIKHTIFVFLLTFCSSFSASYAATHTGKYVAELHSPDTRPCTFFRLKDVAVADPGVSNSEWFSVPQSHTGYKEILAFLVTAYSTGKTINVYTTGAVECEHPGVGVVTF